MSTATPKPDVQVTADGNVSVREVVPSIRAMWAEAPTMALPEDHPYWSVPDELRHRGRLAWDADLERFTARGEIARRLRDEHGWTVHWISNGAGIVDPADIYHYEVRPPVQPKVVDTPAREVAKRLIASAPAIGLSVSDLDGPVDDWDTDHLYGLVLWRSSEYRKYPWDSTVPVIEDGDQ